MQIISHIFSEKIANKSINPQIAAVYQHITARSKDCNHITTVCYICIIRSTAQHQQAINQQYSYITAKMLKIPKNPFAREFLGISQRATRATRL
ncbi:MAG: hypothetical protein K2L32_06475 [Muribaculaceae bacterium]|nr:hypothetical protein [Muribaculaceae bacterium]